jgi:LmbE family N-acetylglucosaminyl deacetylase
MAEHESQKQILLAVLAHPDDESFGMGGTLAFYAQRGVEVHLVCATRGEAGQVAAEFLDGFDSVADRREHELHCAAGVLELSSVHFLDYRDSGMQGSDDNQHPDALTAAPVEEVATKIARYIRQMRPQVILTHDPIGGYKHPDHIAVHKACVEAFHLSSSEAFQDELPPHQPQKLYYHVISKGLLRFGVRVLPLFGKDPHHYGRNGDVDLVELVEDGDFPIHAEIDIRSVEEIKDAASACHVSQLHGSTPRRGPLNWFMRRYSKKEQFMRAFPPAEVGLREKDLFAGIE